MLLPSLIKKNRPSIGIIYLFLIFSHAAIAENKVAEPLHVHGFVAQGVIDVSNSNFVNNDEKISLKLTEIGINSSYHFLNDFRFAVQAVYLNGGNRYDEGVRLDYFLIDWLAYSSEHWEANLYVGRFKNMHWLNSSTRDIPFARPSIILPQSVYLDGLRELGLGGDGAALQLSYSNEKHGEFDFNFSRGESYISDDQADVITGGLAKGTLDHDLDFQGSMYWRPKFSPWRFGFSLLDSEFHYEQGYTDAFFDGDFHFDFYTLNALYEAEKWVLTSEIYYTRFMNKGFYFPGSYRDNIGHGLYVQSHYNLSKKLRFMARYERFYNDKNDKNGHKLEQSSGGLIPRYFGFHNDVALGVTYDFSDRLRLNTEYHWVSGAARLNPIVVPNPQVNDSKYWRMWAMQLMYWF